MMKLSKWSCIFLVFFIGIPSITDAQPRLNTADFGETEWQQILDGEVLVDIIENDRGLPGIQAIFAVPASRATIWHALIDYAHFRDMFDGIDKLQVIEQDENGARVKFWITVRTKVWFFNLPVKKLVYVLYRHYEKPRHKLIWERVSGDLQTMEGSWFISDTPRSGTKLLVYTSYIKVGGVVELVPTGIRRSIAIRETRSMALRLRHWINAHKD